MWLKRNMLNDLIWAYVTYWLLALVGITWGYHRYFAHKEISSKRDWVEVVMLFCGNLCGLTSPLTWVGVHRMHHAEADSYKDPHSPLHHSWWTIIFTTWRIKSIPRKYIKDVIKNPRIMFFHRHGLKVWAATAMATLFHSPTLFLFVCVGPVILGRLGFGLLNYFGHKNGKPIDRPWLNIIAPLEGNHAKHHEV